MYTIRFQTVLALLLTMISLTTSVLSGCAKSSSESTLGEVGLQIPPYQKSLSQEDRLATARELEQIIILSEAQSNGLNLSILKQILTDLQTLGLTEEEQKAFAEAQNLSSKQRYLQAVDKAFTDCRVRSRSEAESGNRVTTSALWVTNLTQEGFCQARLMRQQRLAQSSYNTLESTLSDSRSLNVFVKNKHTHELFENGDIVGMQITRSLDTFQKRLPNKDFRATGKQITTHFIKGDLIFGDGGTSTVQYLAQLEEQQRRLDDSEVHKWGSSKITFVYKSRMNPAVLKQVETYDSLGKSTAVITLNDVVLYETPKK